MRITQRVLVGWGSTICASSGWFQKAREIFTLEWQLALEFGATQNGFQFRKGIGAHDRMRRRCRTIRIIRARGLRRTTGRTRKYWYQERRARAEPLQPRRQSVRGDAPVRGWRSRACLSIRTSFLRLAALARDSKIRMSGRDVRRLFPRLHPRRRESRRLLWVVLHGFHRQRIRVYPQAVYHGGTAL